MKKISTACLLFYIVACGVKSPEVQEQTSSSVQAPEWSNSGSVVSFVKQGIHLVPTSKKHEFEGSLIIWKEGADTKKIAEVLALSTKSKNERNAYLRDIEPVEGIKQSIETKKVELKQVRTDEQNSKISFYEKQSSHLRNASRAWVKTQLIQGKEVDFDQYCELQLLKFGISNFLLDNSFKSRPEALGICSEYYENLRLFQTPNCKDGITPSPGNYVSCVWEGGILKIFDLKLKNGGKTPSDNEIHSFFSDVPSFKQWIKDQTNIDTSIFVFGKVGDLYTIDNAKNQRKGRWKKILFGASELFSDKIRAKRFIEGLTFEQKAGGDKFYTFNDRLFNFHILESNSPALGSEQDTLTSLQKEIPEIFGPEPFADPVLTERIKTINIDIDSLQNKLLAIKKLTDSEFDVFTNSFDLPAASLIRDKELGHTLLSKVELDLVPDEGNFVMVRLHINSGENLFGCFDWESGKSTSCSKNIQEALLVNFDKTSGLLSLESILFPKTVGFSYVAKNDREADFQAIPESALLGRKLRMELYPRVYLDHLDIVTGNVFIEDFKDRYYQGSLSLTSKLP